MVSIAAPAVGSFVTHRDLSDLGYLTLPILFCLFAEPLHYSIRIGMLSFTLAFALLTGNPIAGALLTPRHIWHRPLIFAAVSCYADTPTKISYLTPSGRHPHGRMLSYYGLEVYIKKAKIKKDMTQRPP